MPNDKTDQRGFNTNEPDVERTVASQGGPATGLGDPSNRSASLPQDTATQAAAASTNSDKEKNKEQSSADEADSDGNLELPEGK